MLGYLGFYIAFLVIGYMLIKNKYVGFIIATTGYFMAVADLVCYKIMGQHIDYTTITRLDMTMIHMASSVVPRYFYGIIICTVLVVALHIHLFRNKHVMKYHFNLMAKCALVLLATLLLILSQTTSAYKEMIISTKTSFQLVGYDLNEIYHKLGGTKKLLFKDDVIGKKGKNIIVIYCESLETGLLNEKVFPNETPNLIEMSRNGWHLYSNYIESTGSNWTIGAIYATQTGLPTLFGHDSDIVLKNLPNSKLVSYADVLKKAGYKNLFLTGCRLGFAGTGNVLEKLGYQCLGMESYDANAKGSHWGVHDYDLFRKAKSEYVKLNQAKRPFNMTLLTVDTHFPKGYPDDRLRLYVDQNIDVNSHEYAFASLDYLIKDFVDFIMEQPGGKDTVVVIMGDHLMMGDAKTTPIVRKLLMDKRSIFFMTNIPIKARETSDEIAFYDFPRIILDLAEVETNAKFGREIFCDMSEDYIKKNRELFTMFNLKLLE